MATLQRPRRRPETLSPIERFLASVPPHVPREDAIQRLLRTMTALERQQAMYAWEAMWARPNQLMPDDTSVRTWLIRAGRGFGKTRTGAEAVRKRVARGVCKAVTIIGPTAADARDVMIEGPESGLLAVHPPEFRPVYEPSKRLVTWPNGALGHVRSAEDPDSLRGLQSDTVWGDEPASWKTGKLALDSEAWDNASLGNRLREPFAILTGTPRPFPWLRKLEDEVTTLVTTGSTYDNVGNLAPAFVDLVLGRYEGTRRGRQEVHGQYLEDVEGALWRMGMIDATRFVTFDRMNPWASLAAALTDESRTLLGLGPYSMDRGERRRWVTWVGVDPPGETAECGIIVGMAPERGRGGQDHAVVLDDMTVEGPPEVWGPQVVRAIHRYGAVGAAVESNQGGDMVRSTVHNVDPNVRVEKVRAYKSKYDRAEPVSVLYPRGFVHHLGYFPELETQMTTWVQGEGNSPDRMDALAHLINQLLEPQPVRQGGVFNPATGRRAA